MSFFFSPGLDPIVVDVSRQKTSRPEFYIDNVGGGELLNAIPPNWVLAHTVEWTFCGVCVFIYIYIMVGFLLETIGMQQGYH